METSSAFEESSAHSPAGGLSRVGSTRVKGDIFDREDFNAVDFINKLFPTEASLGSLDDLVSALRRKIRRVDHDILDAVRQQSSSESRARQELGIVQSQIQELFGKIQEIQRKAEDSEAMVQEICRDIKKLDYAKQHLTHAITALRRLAMLTKAIQSLEELLSSRDNYRECAHLLEAVAQLSKYFEQYGHIPKVAELTGKLESIRVALKGSVFDDFRTMLGVADSQPSAETLERLANGCHVVDALGPKVADELVGIVCDKEMSVYKQIYGTLGEVAKLERTDRRHQWLKKRLDDRPELWAVFPQSWRVPQLVSMSFCKVTKSQLAEVLDQVENMRDNVAALLKAVVDTNRFEREMLARFGGGLMEEGSTEDEEVNGGEENSAAADARRRLAATLKQAQGGNGEDEETRNEEEESNLRQARLAFEGSISAVFEKHLRYYVEEEYQEMMNHMSACVKEEADRQWKPIEDSNVLQSANKLFFRIQGSLQRCAKYISRGEPLFLLANAFQKVLDAYCGELVKRLPKTATGQTSFAGPLLGSEWQIKLPEKEEEVVCSVLHTAAYCASTAGTLERAIQRDVQPMYADQVNFEAQEDAFNSLSAQCLSVLVLGVNTRLESALVEMTRLRWDSEETGDESNYVSTIRNVLRGCGPRLAESLDEGEFVFFCDKMVHAFVPRIQETIYKLRRISFRGALQLAIDGEAIKSCLLEFPLTSDRSDIPVASYNAYVEREMGLTISLVKVVQSKPENLVENYLVLMPETAQNVADFQRVLDLKNMKKFQQTDLVATYQNRLPARSAEAAAAASSGGAPAAQNRPFAVGGFSMNAPKGGLFKGSRTMQEAAARTRESLGRMSTAAVNLIPGRFGSAAELSQSDSK
ncbi:hypothetical protein BSKO_06189 [Bryopsis sp. KO-2023]|nr:hypothetical protein BSKO_06189 [Bryopsis sp. KO-2023]